VVRADTLLYQQEFFLAENRADEQLEIIYAPSKVFTRVVEQQLKRLPAIVYADENELASKGFEVARII
jgi:hypothetical protein